LFIPLKNGNRYISSQVNCYLLTVKPLGTLNAANVFQLQDTTCKENNECKLLGLDTNGFILRKSPKWEF